MFLLVQFAVTAMTVVIEKFASEFTVFIFLSCSEKEITVYAHMKYMCCVVYCTDNIVRYHYDCHFILCIEVFYYIVHLRCGNRVKSDNRLIKQNKLFCGT